MPVDPERVAAWLSPLGELVLIDDAGRVLRCTRDEGKTGFFPELRTGRVPHWKTCSHARHFHGNGDPAPNSPEDVGFKR